MASLPRKVRPQVSPIRAEEVASELARLRLPEPYDGLVYYVAERVRSGAWDNAAEELVDTGKGPEWLATVWIDGERYVGQHAAPRLALGKVVVAVTLAEQRRDQQR